jgi:hypothetical protein
MPALCIGIAAAAGIVYERGLLLLLLWTLHNQRRRIQRRLHSVEMRHFLLFHGVFGAIQLQLPVLLLCERVLLLVDLDRAVKTVLVLQFLLVLLQLSFFRLCNDWFPFLLPREREKGDDGNCPYAELLA